nr:hypothetical protein CFP56_01175 [Quercus suber]
MIPSDYPVSTCSWLDIFCELNAQPSAWRSTQRNIHTMLLKTSKRQSIPDPECSPQKSYLWLPDCRVVANGEEDTGKNLTGGSVEGICAKTATFLTSRRHAQRSLVSFVAERRPWSVQACSYLHFEEYVRVFRSCSRHVTVPQNSELEGHGICAPFDPCISRSHHNENKDHGRYAKKQFERALFACRSDDQAARECRAAIEQSQPSKPGVRAWSTLISPSAGIESNPPKPLVSLCCSKACWCWEGGTRGKVISPIISSTHPAAILPLALIVSKLNCIVAADVQEACYFVALVLPFLHDNHYRFDLVNSPHHHVHYSILQSLPRVKKRVEEIQRRQRLVNDNHSCIPYCLQTSRLRIGASGRILLAYQHRASLVQAMNSLVTTL